MYATFQSDTERKGPLGEPRRRWEDNVNPLKPSGHYMYHRFNTPKLYILPTQCICVPYGSHNKQGLFPQTAITGWAL
jgi:hypothetical protein